MSNRSESRRRTPWDDTAESTVIQEFLKMHYIAEQHRPKKILEKQS